MFEFFKTLYDFDDILIQPETLSDISSRSEITIRDNNGSLPIFTAPMDTVINEKNYSLFQEHGIRPVLPRIPNPPEDYYSARVFYSYSLTDFERIFLKKKIGVPNDKRLYALIDVANGHMKKLLEMSKRAKEMYGKSMCLMVGNVANPLTFEEYCKVGVDMVRIGIGNGNGCLTTVQTGVGFSMASLIERCYSLKKFNDYKTEIVADGGFKKYADIIKALGLGANYVMLGSILNKCLESAGETTLIDNTLGNHNTIDQYSSDSLKRFNSGIPLYKVFRGMSTKDVQKSWSKDVLKTSEGVVRKHNVEYTIEGWVKNFEDYLRSAMSYTSKKELHQFIGGVTYNHITLNSFKRFDK